MTTARRCFGTPSRPLAKLRCSERKRILDYVLNLPALLNGCPRSHGDLISPQRSRSAAVRLPAAGWCRHRGYCVQGTGALVFGKIWQPALLSAHLFSHIFVTSPMGTARSLLEGKALQIVACRDSTRARCTPARASFVELWLTFSPQPLRALPGTGYWAEGEWQLAADHALPQRSAEAPFLRSDVVILGLVLHGV